MKVLNIYHGNCADGFMSAWVVRNAHLEGVLVRGVGEGYPLTTPVDLKHYPGVYQKQPPWDMIDNETHVLITDFSYKRILMQEMAARAASITVIDHHKTAEADLEDLDAEWSNVYVYFNMHNSGAMLTWYHFFPRNPPPAMVKHVEDRDLWRFAMAGTRAIQANIFSYPYEFPVWDELVERIERDPHTFEKEGDAIERKHFKDIRELLAVTTRTLYIGGYPVPAANLPYTMASDAGHILAKEHPEAAFAACFYQNKDGNYTFSLRSANDFDVSAVAAKYGGGGHRAAAGFTVDWDKLIFEGVLDSTGNLDTEHT